MAQLFLFIVVALTVAAIAFGVTVLLSGGDPGLTRTEPDGRAVPLPADRPLAEEDISRTRFDVTLRGYRMAQVDQVLRRAAYDIGYKGELIGVLEAEVIALREGRIADAEMLRRAREAAVQPVRSPESAPAGAEDADAVAERPDAPPQDVVPDAMVPAAAAAVVVGDSERGTAAGAARAAATGDADAATGDADAAAGATGAATGAATDATGAATGAATDATGAATGAATDATGVGGGTSAAGGTAADGTPNR